MYKLLVSITCLAVLATIGFLAVVYAPKIEADYVHGKAVAEFAAMRTHDQAKLEAEGCSSIVSGPVGRLDALVASWRGKLPVYASELFVRCENELNPMIDAVIVGEDPATGAPHYNAKEKADLDRLIQGSSNY